MYIGNKDEFKRRSEYQKRIAAMTVPEKKDKKVCRNHPIAVWGKKKDGTWYEKCFRGFNSGESCHELIVE